MVMGNNGIMKIYIYTYIYTYIHTYVHITNIVMGIQPTPRRRKHPNGWWRSWGYPEMVTISAMG
jgi:hypothetical protein